MEVYRLQVFCDNRAFDFMLESGAKRIVEMIDKSGGYSFASLSIPMPLFSYHTNQLSRSSRRVPIRALAAVCVFTVRRVASFSH